MIDGALEFLRGAEGAAARSQNATWCSGALAASQAPDTDAAHVAALYVLLRPSSFDDVALLRLALPVDGCDDATCVLRATAYAGAGANVLYAGTPASTTAGVAALHLASDVARAGAPVVRAGGALLELRADPPAALRAAWAPAATFDDGGLAATVGACEAADGTLRACALVAGFELGYDPDCGARHASTVHDEVLLWRVGPADAHVMAARAAAELRALYNLSDADDVLVTAATWQPLLRLSGALRVRYELRAAEPRERATPAQLRSLARALQLGGAVRPSFADHAAPLALLALALAVSAALLARGARRALHASRARGSKRAVTVTTSGAGGIYEKSLTL